MSEPRAYSSYQLYALSLLFLTIALSYFDRHIVAVLVVPITAEFQLRDTEAGLLSGLAFGLVYALAGIPVARLADRGSRAKVLSISLAVWSMMTMLCGFAGNFVALFLARMGVGAGESGAMPTTQALVTELFSEQQRARVLSIIAVGGNVGLFLGLALGGIINDRWGWRTAFLMAGAPGFLLSVLVWMTLRNPVPTAQRAPRADTESPQSFIGALSILSRQRSYVLLIAGGTFAATGLYAVHFWTPAFLIRSHQVTLAESGGLFALFNTTAAIVGALLGGYLADRGYRRDRRAYLWVLVLSFGASVPFLLITYLASSMSIALAASAVSGLISGLYPGPLFAQIQALGGPRLRATAAAIFMLVMTLAGAALGPVYVGVISDMLQPWFGSEALRYALCVAPVTFILAVLCFLAALRSVVVDMECAEKDERCAIETGHHAVS